MQKGIDVVLKELTEVETVKSGVICYTWGPFLTLSEGRSE